MFDIKLATYPTAFFMPGGGEAQFLSTLKELSKINKNVKSLDYLDTANILNTSLFHIFTVCYSIETYVNALNDLNIRYVLSPIHWPIDKEISNLEKNRIKHILSNSAKILTNSNAESILINDFYDLNRINDFKKVVNGISKKMNKFAKIFKQKSTQNNKPKVLFCGNIDNRKNLIALSRCCEIGDYDLTIAGGVRDQKLSSILFKKKFINYVGEYIPYSQKHINLLTSHDVFCLPSLYETPGLAALEAAAVGIPIVITDQGCTKEYFEDNVFFCSPYKDDSILSGIENALIKGSVDDKFIDYIFEFYTWEKAAIKTNLVYEELLNDNL